MTPSFLLCGSTGIRIYNDFSAHELHEFTQTSSSLICVITLRQLVLSANNTNAIRFHAVYQISVIGYAELKVRNCTSNSSCNENNNELLIFSVNSCNSWLKKIPTQNQKDFLFKQ